jgi:hypothetical protein
LRDNVSEPFDRPNSSLRGLEIEDESEARLLLERQFRGLCRDEGSPPRALILIGVIRDVVGDNSGLPDDGRDLYFESEGSCIECCISLRRNAAGAPIKNGGNTR